MEGLIKFWTWVYIIGLGAFGLLVLVVVPLGARNLFKLFAFLRQKDSDTDG